MARKLFLAPMEGITGYIFRNAYNKYFGEIDGYVTPFISPTHSKILNHRELQDILPENNRGVFVVPQILANDADLFVETARRLKEYGYNEINLNLGCPSGTVVSKKKGSGLLADLDMLDDFLCRIFEEVNAKMGIDISIKTRIGKEDIDEFHSILTIYNQYPIRLLTIHPRIQKEFYKGKCHLDVFEMAVRESNSEICYNGDINSCEDLENISLRNPGVDNYMIGRGILRNPFLAEEIKQNGDDSKDSGKLRSFHDELYAGYEEIFSGDRNVLFKMKELWSYLGESFEDCDKVLKQIRKATKKEAYFDAVNKLF